MQNGTKRNPDIEPAIMVCLQYGKRYENVVSHAPPIFQSKVVAIPANVLFFGPTISIDKAYCDTMTDICTKPTIKRRMLNKMGELTKEQHIEKVA